MGANDGSALDYGDDQVFAKPERINMTVTGSQATNESPNLATRRIDWIN